MCDMYLIVPSPDSREISRLCSKKKLRIVLIDCVDFRAMYLVGATPSMDSSVQ